MIPELLVDADGAQVTVAWPSPGLALAFLGASGRCSVRGALAAEVWTLGTAGALVPNDAPDENAEVSTDTNPATVSYACAEIDSALAASITTFVQPEVAGPPDHARSCCESSARFACGIESTCDGAGGRR